MNRKVAPLVPADDAIVIDTTKLNAEEVFIEVQRILEQAVLDGKLKQSHIQ
jgi:cytidylate kinase